MDALGIKPGMVIGEVGAGRGYFTFKLSKRVGKDGKIYANDIKQSVLDYIDDKCRERGISNIQTVKGEYNDPLFPGKNLDMIVMVYVLHHLSQPVKYLKNLKHYLKPGAVLAILEQDPGKTHSASGHFHKKEVVLERIKQAGYRLIRIETFLPKDNIYVLGLFD